MTIVPYRNEYLILKKENLTVSTIMNECSLYDIVHVRGLLFNNSAEKLK